MDYKFKEKTNNNSIVIAILYNKFEYDYAQSLKNKIISKYPNGIKSYTIKTKLINYNELEYSDANIYYLFHTDSINIEKVINKASKLKALTFSYLKDDLKYGVMISLNVSTKIKPMLNLNAIRANGITLRPVLLNISKIYNKPAKATFINTNKELVK